MITRRLCLALFLLCLVGTASGALQIDRLRVVNVTPSGFTLMGEASGPATTGVRVYADAVGTQDITDELRITRLGFQGGDPTIEEQYHQDNRKLALRDRIEPRGLLRIRIDGAAPATTYYYHAVADNGSEQAQWPAAAPAAVTTAVRNGFLSGSHQVLVTIDAADPEGWLIRAATASTSHPVAAVVGDGAANDQAYLALSNLMTPDGTTWQPSGNAEVVLTLERGGQELVTRTLDLDLSGDFSVSSLHPVTIDLEGGPTIALLNPARALYTEGESIGVSWDDEITEMTAEISLYYDDNDIGADGTEIIAALPADADGVDDSYSWDTTAIADGIYYLYGTVTETEGSATAYAAAPVAIDRAGTDGDADTMADLWEDLFFDTRDRNGAMDFDLDGESDAGEFRDRTNPGVPDLRLALRAGLNLIAMPMEPAMTSFELATRIRPDLISLGRLNQGTQAIERTTMVGGVPQGIDFPIQPHEGLMIEMAAGADLIVVGAASLEMLDLVPGQNLVGFQRVPEGFDAEQLLARIGGSTAVAGVRRYVPETGRFETLVFGGDGSLVGINFPIRRGEAYLVSMRQESTGLTLP